jgi:hypothetical protein
MSDTAPKIAPFALPERYELTSRPGGAPRAIQDAHRQTHFLLSSDLALFERAMNLQLEAVRAVAKQRRPERAALFGFRARTFSYLSDACVLFTRGSYTSCPPLLRAACDCIAAQRSLIEDGFDEYHEWLASAVGKDREHAASYIDLGRYRAGSALAQDERLGSTYRFLSDLTMPHLGGTLFQTGPGSTEQRLSLSFNDNTFHLGWAELIAGWLLLLAASQVDTPLAIGESTPSGQLEEDIARLRKEIDEALASQRRCRAEELPDGRRLIHNFRRAVSGTPKRVVL